MTTSFPTPQSVTPATWVAIDIAKDAHVALIETAAGQRRCRVANTLEDIDQLITFLHTQPTPVRIAFEPTGMYHRPLAYRLVTAGFDVVLVSSLTCARYREARYASWDKNDPKDARVILEVLQQGMTMPYIDPLLAGWHDAQEVAKTYWQVTLARTRVQHSLLTHFLPIYWPEFARYWRTSRSAQFIRFLLAYPTPGSITAMSCDTFLAASWTVAGRKVGKRAWLTGVYELATRSVALPIALESMATATFRLRLQSFLDLSAQRTALEQMADTLLGDHPDYLQLQTIPGIGPVFALTILAEAGDLRRFAHHRQFLKFCGLDLAKSQLGRTRGHEQLSKRGNSRLRSAFWYAGRIAVRSREHSVRDKFERYVAVEPFSADRRRKAYTAIAAKMARIAYAVIKTGRPYRSYFEHDLPSGSIPLKRAVEAPATS
ncbi:MAG: IS110 family transposase [Gemmatimonadales bacterium]|nr:IS110 family transposase [Gemmatimonadales bacterium]